MASTSPFSEHKKRIERERFQRVEGLIQGSTCVANISPDGLIPLDDRLEYSAETIDFKHLILLPKQHRLTRLFVELYREKLLHAGPQLLSSSIRQKYWMLVDRNIVRQVFHRYYECFRAKPSQVKLYMCEMPKDRVTISRPFSRPGIDFFGQVYIIGPRWTAVSPSVYALRQKPST